MRVSLLSLGPMSGFICAMYAHSQLEKYIKKMKNYYIYKNKSRKAYSKVSPKNLGFVLVYIIKYTNFKYLEHNHLSSQVRYKVNLLLMK